MLQQVLHDNAFLEEKPEMHIFPEAVKLLFIFHPEKIMTQESMQPVVSLRTVLNDLVEKAERNDVHEAAALILLSKTFQDRWLGDSDSTSVFQQKKEIHNAFDFLMQDLMASPARSLSMGPADRYKADAVRAELPQADCLDALTQPLVTGKDALSASAWNFLGALTYLQKYDTSTDLLVRLADREPLLVADFRDSQALKDQWAASSQSIAERGVHQPVNQWLPALKDSLGQQHDILDLAVLMSGHGKFYFPAALANQSVDDRSDLAAALALHAVRAHDVLAQNGEKNLVAAQPGKAAEHVDHVMAVALAFGAAKHLSQENWEQRANVDDDRVRGLLDAKASTSASLVPGTAAQPLAMALLRNIDLVGDEGLARGLGSLMKNGHDVLDVLPAENRELRALVQDLPQSLRVVSAAEALVSVQRTESQLKSDAPALR